MKKQFFFLPMIQLSIFVIADYAAYILQVFCPHRRDSKILFVNGIGITTIKGKMVAICHRFEYRDLNRQYKK